MRRTAVRLSFLIAISLASAGCQTVKGWLRPWVCECSTPHTNALEGHAPDEHEGDNEPDEYAAHDHESGNDEHDEDYAEPAPDESDTPEPPETAELDEAALMPAELVWTKSVDLSVQEERDRVKNSYIVRGELDASRVLIEGSFGPKGQPEVAILEPGRTIEIYSDAARVARANFAVTPAPEQFGAFVVATELVRDARTELVVTGVQTDVDGRRFVTVSVWKVIGNAVAEVFERPIAAEVNGAWQPVARVRFLTGQKHRFIEYTPLEGEGKDTPQIFRWNRWEGMFRVPAAAPTAPRRT